MTISKAGFVNLTIAMMSGPSEILKEQVRNRSSGRKSIWLLGVENDSTTQSTNQSMHITVFICLIKPWFVLSQFIQSIPLLESHCILNQKLWHGLHSTIALVKHWNKTTSWINSCSMNPAKQNSLGKKVGALYKYLGCNPGKWLSKLANPFHSQDTGLSAIFRFLSYSFQCIAEIELGGVKRQVLLSSPSFPHPTPIKTKSQSMGPKKPVGSTSCLLGTGQAKLSDLTF